MLLTGLTRSSLHLAPRGNVCDGGKFFFSTSLILLWLTVACCFRHRAEHTEIERLTGYLQCDFHEEIVREICGFEDYGDPPAYNLGRQRAQRSEFETVHVPRFSEQKKSCVVCYKQKKAQRKVYSYCAAPQCQGKHMHVTKQRNCFDIFYSREYHS